jgi:hypothetical protein
MASIWVRLSAIAVCSKPCASCINDPRRSETSFGTAATVSPSRKFEIRAARVDALKSASFSNNASMAFFKPGDAPWQ